MSGKCLVTWAVCTHIAVPVKSMSVTDLDSLLN